MIEEKLLMEIGSASTPLVSIIMPLYGPHSYMRAGLLTLLDSLPGWPNPELSVELVLVDNSAQAATTAFVTALAGPVRVIPASLPCPYGQANNIGAAEARGKWLLLLNFDTIPLPGWLPALLAAAEETGAAVVGSQLRYPDETIQHAGLGFNGDGDPVSLYHMQPVTAPAVSVPHPVRAVTSAVFLVERATYERFDGFDERYRNSYDDLDFCCRVREAGLTVQYAPQSQLYHFSSVNDIRFIADEPNRALFLATWRDKLIAEQDDWAAIEGPGMAAEVQANQDTRTLTPQELDAKLIAARPRLGEQLWWQLRHLTWDAAGLQGDLDHLRAAYADQHDRLEQQTTHYQQYVAQQEQEQQAQQAWSAQLEQQLAERQAWIEQLTARLERAETGGVRAQLRRWRGQ